MTEQLVKRDFKEEIGEKADQETVEELTGEISSSWRFRSQPPSRPVLLCLGGFQGSGKTTALELIQNDLDLVIISPDKIRYRLFEKGWQRGEEFTHTVNAAKNKLIEKALSTGHNIAIDQYTTRARSKIVKESTEKFGRTYKLIFIYLTAPQKVLEQRVATRKPFPGQYNGTVEELRASIIKYGYPDYGLYDRVLDSVKMNPQQLANSLRSYFT